MTAKLILGTGNKKKGLELDELLSPIGISLRTLADLRNVEGQIPPIEVVEDGETFAENGRKKAVEQALHLNEWVLAEDSGLCVPALDGHPGVYSARYSGENATDETNNQRLLEELDAMQGDQRNAYYVCHMVLSDPKGNVRAESEGRCHGRMVREYRGEGGFGYDPLFEIIEYRRTFGEFPSTVKACLSHRARATRRLIPQLLALINDEGWVSD